MHGFNDQVDSFTWALSWVFKLQRARREDNLWARQLEGFSLFG